MALVVFVYLVYTSSDQLGSPKIVYERLLQVAAKSRSCEDPLSRSDQACGPVSGNYNGSYATMLSSGGLVFGIINIVGNFGTVFVDNGYWVSAIAARPSSTHKGYLLGGLVWFSVPFSMATALGIGALALDLPITADEANQGLVPAATAIALMGKGGSVLLFDVELQMDIESKNTASNHHRQDMGNKVSVAAGAGDTNTWGGIIQLYWDNILENCLDGSHHVRHSSLKIVEIVLRQGLVHPITCVPHLVALETDPQEVISKLAHHLLMNMNEKYPSIFESRLGDGLQMSFRFFQSIVSTHNVTSGNVKGRSFGSAFACVRPGICRIYRIIRANRMSRNKFLHSIIRKFEPGCWKFSSLPFLLYCTEIIASLPFTSPDEPLYLVYAINRILQVRVGPIESNMKMWYSNFLQGNSAESYIGSGREYKSVQHIFNQDEIVTSPVISVSFGISNENMQSFQSDCQDALALQLLLKLKRYLKIAYSLSDARCQAYSPKDHQKFEETLSKHNAPFNISDTSLTLPKSYEDMVVFFKELKQLLKDDTLDYITYTSSIKRKRPTPKSSKKRAQPVRGENDDDGENDNEWIGGARKLDFSGQNSGGRVTRQRYNSNQMT